MEALKTTSNGGSWYQKKERKSMESLLDFDEEGREDQESENIRVGGGFTGNLGRNKLVSNHGKR